MINEKKTSFLTSQNAHATLSVKDGCKFETPLATLVINY